MRDLTSISTDPADYISGPTGNQVSRTNGGTNRSGGVSVVDTVETGQQSETPAEQPPAEQPPAPPAQ
jgi:hypothetical protein